MNDPRRKPLGWYVLGIEDDEDRERREQQEYEDSLEDGPAYVHDIHGRDAQRD